MTDSVSGPAHRLFRRLAALVPLVGLLALAAAPAAQAQSSLGDLYPKWQVDLSGALVIMGSTIRVDGSEGEGTMIAPDSSAGKPFLRKASTMISASRRARAVNWR